jgi:hypothetical protein
VIILRCQVFLVFFSCSLATLQPIFVKKKNRMNSPSDLMIGWPFKNSKSNDSLQIVKKEKRNHIMTFQPKHDDCPLSLDSFTNCSNPTVLLDADGNCRQCARLGRLNVLAAGHPETTR